MTFIETNRLLLRNITPEDADIMYDYRNNEICAIDIEYALILDRMYKNKLKEGDLDRFTKDQIAEMQATCAKRRADIESLYETVNLLGL